MLINLLSNAIKYNRRGGSVVVETHASGGEATLEVRDTGRGLRTEQIAALFEPFNRFGVETEGIEGTGIGLTIVKSLVDGMGGRIEVDSEPGRGAVFRVTLPGASTANAGATEAEGSPAHVLLPAQQASLRSAAERSSTSKTTTSTCSWSKSS